MNKLSKNQKGFSAVIVILALVIVVLIGVVGYMAYHNHHKTTPVASTAKVATKAAAPKTVTPVDPLADWKPYCSTLGGLCLKYPASWKYKQDTSNSGPAGSEVNTITSPSGKVVVVYAPDVQLGGQGVNESTETVSVTPNAAQDFAVVGAVNSIKDPVSFTAELFATPQTATSNDDKFTAGSVIDNSYAAPWHQFINPKQTTTRNQFLAVTHDGSPFTGNYFASVAAAKAWLTSAEVKTAQQILATVSYQ